MITEKPTLDHGVAPATFHRLPNNQQRRTSTPPAGKRTQGKLATGALLTALMAGSSSSPSAALPQSLTANGQGSTPSANSVEVSTQLLGSCPGGVATQQVSFTDCYPPDPACTTLLDLDWGNPGVPGSLLIPKFDPALGSLQKAELELTYQYVGDVCIDNPQAGCCIAEMDMKFISLANGANNNPQLPPAAAVIQFDDDVSITPPGFVLGPDDGVADCPIPVSANASGQCTSTAADHVQSSWDTTFPPLHTPVDQPNDLVPFILSPGTPTDIVYSVDAQSLVTGTICIQALPFVTTTAQARVEIKVTYTYCPNVSPTCVAADPLGDYQVDENSFIDTIDLLKHAFDVDGCVDCSSFQIVNAAPLGNNAFKTTHGTLVVTDPNASGLGNEPPGAQGCITCSQFKLMYSPDTDYCGPDSFEFTVKDDIGDISSPCAVNLLVNPVNDPPVCLPCDPFGGVTSFIGGQPYLADFTLCVQDPDALSGCGLLLDPTTFDPSADCGQDLFVPIQGNPGKFRFTPPLDECIPCIVTLQVKDLGGLALETPCSWNIQIERPNIPPSCLPADTWCVEAGNEIQIDFSGYVTDEDEVLNDGCGFGIDLNSLTPTPLNLGCGGTFTPVDQANAIWKFTAPPAVCNTCNFAISVMDLGGVPNDPQDCNFTIRVTSTNTAPVCVPGGTICVPEDSVDIPINVSGYVTDNDDPECAGVIDPGGYSATVDIGSLVQLSPGSAEFQYTPPPDYCGPATISFEAMDTGGVLDCVGSTTSPLSVQCSIDICVTPVNDPPVAVDDSFATIEGTPILVDLCANDFDPEGLLPDSGSCGCSLDCDSITIDDPVQACGTLLPDPGGSGRFLFTPAEGFVNDECCFTYTIWDNCANVGATGCAAGACSEDLQPKSDQGQVCISVQPCVDTNLRTGASLLLFPEYDNRPGFDSVHTVTNTHDQKEIWLEFEFVNGEDCTRSDRAHLLTPGDTFSFVTRDFLSDLDRGYSYVYATCGPSGEPVAFNHLIGNQIVLDGHMLYSYGVNAIGFQGIENPGATITPCGLFSTEQSNDTVRNFDGIEYNPTPDRIYIPRFLGQTDIFQSELILIALSGGKKFDTSLDLIIFNDNEQDFSAQLTFYCWESVPLMDITNLFSNEYLANNTNNDPEELFGNPTIETGWMVLDGNVATSTHASIMDPAFYAILIDHTGPDQQAADIPWSTGCQTNGGLLPVSVHGDY